MSKVLERLRKRIMGSYAKSYKIISKPEINTIDDDNASSNRMSKTHFKVDIYFVGPKMISQ